jgi:hypothetical protein
MSAEDKQFAIDLLRALDEGIGTDTSNNDDNYYAGQMDGCRRELKRTIKVLTDKGYRKCQN